MQFSLQRLVALMFLLVSSARAAGSDYHVGIGEPPPPLPLTFCALSVALIYSVLFDA